MIETGNGVVIVGVVKTCRMWSEMEPTAGPGPSLAKCRRRGCMGPPGTPARLSRRPALCGTAQRFISRQRPHICLALRLSPVVKVRPSITGPGV